MGWAVEAKAAVGAERRTEQEEGVGVVAVPVSPVLLAEKAVSPWGLSS